MISPSSPTWLMTRKILHLDLDAFFCAVEELRNPDLRGKPFAVGGSPQGRGVVASCSYAARQYGIHSAMPMAQAIRLCPDLIVVSNRHGLYDDVSRRVMARLRQFTPLLEQLSIDEAFLDLSDLPEPPAELARRIQAAIRNEFSLPCSLGVATNKLVAKIANDVGKSRARGAEPPNAITVVPPGQEAAFLAPLPTRALWGVGPKTADRLAALGIHTIGDIAAYPEAELVRLFGKHGHDLARRARGIDDRPVVTEHETKSVSKEVTFPRDVADRRTLQRTLRRLSEGVGRNLRRKGLQGSTVKIKLRWPDFTTITRQTTLSSPTDQDNEIYEAANRLFSAAWKPGRPVRLLGVGVSGFGRGYRQLSFWDIEADRDRRLQETLDRLRSKYGVGAVTRGGRESGG
ncbi:MAG: DNA polymerase IV [Caldilineae bacterium]|nr:MAG: DNA polymerase IV [Caldilineae bacterium]